MVLELLAKGSTIEEILEDYPDLEAEDIQAALFYAYHLVSQEEIIERDEATEELLAISGFKSAFETGKQQVKEGKVKDWRAIRDDV